MIPEIQSGRKRTLALAVTFALSVCLGLFLFLAPALIIRPFRFQSARALHFSGVFVAAGFSLEESSPGSGCLPGGRFCGDV